MIIDFQTIGHRACVRASALLAAALLITACSGDGRPFTEAVEANNLQLNTITIHQPAGLLDDLVVSPGERIGFTLQATNLLNEEVAISSGNRRWRVDNPAVGSIDENGLFTAISPGVVNIFVDVGSVPGGGFEVEVRREELVSINNIEGVESLERCLPQPYFAVGRFESVDGPRTSSLRGLLNTEWRVGNPDIGSIDEPVNGSVNVTGLNINSLELIASVDQISLTTLIPVESTLQEITIGPDVVAVPNGSTLSLVALGFYVKDGEDDRSDVDITDSVQWFAEEDNTVLLVGNTALNKGVVTTRAVGNETVVASCGNLSGQRTVSVIEGSSGSTGISFQDGDSLTIFLSAGARQLPLSTGASFSSATEISGDDSALEWRVIENPNVVAISSSGVVTPLQAGTATVQATYEGQFAQIEIQVILP